MTRGVAAAPIPTEETQDTLPHFSCSDLECPPRVGPELDSPTGRVSRPLRLCTSPGLPPPSFPLSFSHKSFISSWLMLLHFFRVLKFRVCPQLPPTFLWTDMLSPTSSLCFAFCMPPSSSFVFCATTSSGALRTFSTSSSPPSLLFNVISSYSLLTSSYCLIISSCLWVLRRRRRGFTSEQQLHTKARHQCWFVCSGCNTCNTSVPRDISLSLHEKERHMHCKEHLQFARRSVPAHVPAGTS